MTTLNLIAHGKPQELILAYLQENVSDVLAEKINNGTPFTKDGKQLVNKKTLDGFMTFASDEAKKLAEKAARSACVKDDVVYGWAIHYFEEDSIEGKLFNEDGTEYAPPAKCRKVESKPVKVESPKPKQQQASLWDMLNDTEEKAAESEQVDDHELVDNADNKNNGEERNKFIQTDGKKIDTVTGEVMDKPTEDVTPTVSPSSFDEDTAVYLFKLLDGKMDIA